MLILSCKVVITNLEANSAIEVDAKKWPDAQADDASAFYKVKLNLWKLISLGNLVAETNCTQLLSYDDIQYLVKVKCIVKLYHGITTSYDVGRLMFVCFWFYVVMHLFLDSIFQCCIYWTFGLPDARFKRLLWPCSWEICDTQVSRRHKLILWVRIYRPNIQNFHYFVQICISYKVHWSYSSWW